MIEEYRVEVWRQSYEPDPTLLRSMLIHEGYTVTKWRDRPGAEYGEHKHSEHQTHWVISGSLEMQLSNGMIHVLNAGDRDFMPANTYHSARVLGEEPVVYLIGAKRT